MIRHMLCIFIQVSLHGDLLSSGSPAGIRDQSSLWAICKRLLTDNNTICKRLLTDKNQPKKQARMAPW